MTSLRKILHYFLFYVASTLFVYFFFIAAMSLRSISDFSSLTLDFLGKRVFLPLLYSSFSIVVATLSQSCFLKREEKTETLIYACFNTIFFLLVLTLSILLFVLGKRDDSLPLTVSAIALLSFSGIEIAYSAFMLISLKKTENPVMPIDGEKREEK